MPLKPMLSLVLIAFMTACGSTSSAGNPADTVQKYLQAKVTGQQDTLRGLLCAAMEGDLEREAMSFSGVKAELEGVVCTAEGTSGTATVTCTGNIVAEYNNEKTRFPLGKYKVVQESGQWKWCGETQ